LVLNRTDFIFPLKFRLRWPLAANVNIYVASADALANRRRRAANFLRVLKIMPKRRRWSLVWLVDVAVLHLVEWCGSLLIKPTNSTGAGSPSSL